MSNDELSGWQWFKLGMLAGVIWGLFREPRGCCCCGVIALLLVVVLGALLFGLVLSSWKFALVAMAVVVLVLAIRGRGTA